jgi:hypothetical protein
VCVLVVSSIERLPLTATLLPAKGLASVRLVDTVHLESSILAIMFILLLLSTVRAIAMLNEWMLINKEGGLPRLADDRSL